MNFPETPAFADDIAKLSVEECCRLAGSYRDNSTSSMASPPCQGFSMIGGRDSPTAATGSRGVRPSAPRPSPESVRHGKRIRLGQRPQ